MDLIKAFIATVIVIIIIIVAVYFSYKKSSKAEKKPIGQLTKNEIKGKSFEELLEHIDGHTGGKIILLIFAVIVVIGSILWEGIKWLFGIY